MIPDIIIEAGDWPDSVELWSKGALEALVESLNAPAADIAVLLTDDAHIRALNLQFRGKDKATNVLSWPAIEYERERGGIPIPKGEISDGLGDLAFGFQTCVKEAEAIGLENHYKHLIIHGALHLLGYNHESEKDAEIMEALEIKALSRLDIKNPYEGEGI